MKKIVFIIGLLILGFSESKAQYVGDDWQWYLGPHIGGMHYVGDLSTTIPSFQVINPGGGIQASAQYKRYFAIQAGYLFGRLEGADSLISEDRAARGFDFSTTINDFYLMGKINLLFHNRHRKSYNQLMWYPKLLLGVGYFRFYPKTQLNGADVYLREYGTEGQTLSASVDGTEYPEPYNIWAINYKMGLEISVDIGGKTRSRSRNKRRATLDFFGYYVRTNTDYIDDLGGGEYIKRADLQYTNRGGLEQLAYPANRVGGDGTPSGTRGNPETNDGWFVYGVALSYQIDSRGRRRGGFGPRGVRRSF